MKKKIKVEEEMSEVTGSCEECKSCINKLDISFGNEDMNKVVEKINEIIEKI